MVDNTLIQPEETPKTYHDALWRLSLDGKITLSDGKEIPVRAVYLGDSDKRDVDDYAKAAARATYQAALDPSSESYQRYMVQIGRTTKGDLIGAILESERFRLNQRVVSEVFPAEIETEIDTIGDSIEHDLAVEEIERETERTRAEWVKDELDALETEHAELEYDDLVERVRKITANTLATAAFSYAYQDYTLYCGILKEDGKSKFFAEVPKNAPEYIKRQALALYIKVDPYLFRLT